MSRSLVAAAFVVVAVAAAARPAAACRCIDPPLERAAARADAVFTGTVVAVRSAGTGTSGHDVLTVAVDAVWKGAVGRRLELRSPGHSCGLVTLGAKVGRTLLVTATTVDGVPSARQCDGTRFASAGARARLSKLLGPPRTP